MCIVHTLQGGYTDESFVLPALIRFGGEAVVDEEGSGALLYRFPSLQASAVTRVSTMTCGNGHVMSMNPPYKTDCRHSAKKAMKRRPHTVLAPKVDGPVMQGVLSTETESHCHSVYCNTRCIPELSGYPLK